MKRSIYAKIFFLFIFSMGGIQGKPLKVLHMSLHAGCINDFEEVGKELGIDLTSWYIHKSHVHFEGFEACNSVYNITHERAERVWNKHKDYFNQFDVIVTSDTAPLSRIFLQNGWQKPLIIWVCNRFDYADRDNPHEYHFPDQEYYYLFKLAACAPHVKIVAYTPYEHFYAANYRGIDIGTRTIKPIGLLDKGTPADFKSQIPTDVDKSKTLFLFPRMEPHQLRWIQRQCEVRGIKTYTGGYNGPEDLKGFKGVLFFPYAWSNLALFENIQRGIIHFVPSMSFFRELNGAPIRIFTYANHEICEWWRDEHKGLFVYFDSWEDLAKKIQTTNYETLSKKNKEFGVQHRKEMLNRWRQTFTECEEWLKKNR